jgi:hypothetical protein
MNQIVYPGASKKVVGLGEKMMETGINELYLG